MTLHDSVREQLGIIEALLRHHHHWQSAAPDASVFDSTQPFCMDTLEPLEWLQWVLIPRMHVLLDSGQPLPQSFAIAPYYEIALDAAHPMREHILPTLQQLDAFFADEEA
ncbi:YqcC family protein [Superficieibacter sp.]|uniref:YqcC family protein n=1 Tax=Superficieibacter sp. TaxID=2303322 RepID=UPI0028ADF78D|nr:YqcC family protein [Superficieibacter sp.]